MKKLFFTLFLYVFVFSNAIAQKDAILQKINFDTLQSFEKLIEKAKNENKFIFVDVYTDWCKPCKEMDKYVFTDSLVANFYNSNFINVKVDGESKIGEDFVHEYNIQVYPSFVFFDSNGNLLNKSEGYLSSLLLYDMGLQLVKAERIENIEDTKKKTKKMIAELYRKNPCDISNTQNYLLSFNQQEYKEHYQEIVMTFTNCVEEKNLYTPEYVLFLLDNFIRTKSDSAYPFYEKHKEDFRRNYGDSLIALESDIMFYSFFEQMETTQNDIDMKGKFEQEHIDSFESSTNDLLLFAKTLEKEGKKHNFEFAPIARFYNVIQNLSSIFYATNKDMYYKYLIEYNQPVHFEKSIEYFSKKDVYGKMKKNTLYYLNNFYSETDELKSIAAIWQYTLNNNYLTTSSDYFTAAKVFYLNKEKQEAQKMLQKAFELKDESFDDEKYNELKSQINQL